MKWEIREAYESELESLSEEGWEPFGVRKGDFVMSGFSFGWLLADTIYYLKRPLTKPE